MTAITDVSANNATMAKLQEYARLQGCEKVLSSHADLEPKDRVLHDMRAWCKQHGSIAVLKSGVILTSDPVSRALQNCKILMANKGIHPGKVMPATPTLINMLLTDEYDEDIIPVDIDVSVQQQRLRMLVKEALQAQATDIHIEVREEAARIRFRKHGELYLHTEWSPRIGREVAAVSFNKETDQAPTHFNPSIPQNASMPLRIDDVDIRLRLASLPANGGFDVVMRLLTIGDKEIYSLEALGYNEEQIYLIKKAVHMPHGAIIVSGPTGSGKTTTLAGCMQMVDDNRKVYTIEDPVEKIIEGVTQIPANTDKEDRDFASMGRTALRMDPDVMVLGEMRDEDTAAVMIRAAMTGHLVFSTLHTNTAPTIITRLIDLGIKPELLADNNMLVCLICQRLIPILCPHCAIPLLEADRPVEQLQRWQQFFADDLEKIKVRGLGCVKCNNLGIVGRTVVAEVIWLDETGRQYIKHNDTLGWEKHLRQQGWKSYRDQALEFVAAGKCDPTDAEKVTGELSIEFTETNFNYNAMRKQKK